MINKKKCFMISAVEALTVLIVLLVTRAVRRRHFSGIFEKTGSGIDERLKESKVALEKAAARVQSVFEHIRNRAA